MNHSHIPGELILANTLVAQARSLGASLGQWWAGVKLTATSFQLVVNNEGVPAKDVLHVRRFRSGDSEESIRTELMSMAGDLMWTMEEARGEGAALMNHLVAHPVKAVRVDGTVLTDVAMARNGNDVYLQIELPQYLTLVLGPNDFGSAIRAGINAHGEVTWRVGDYLIAFDLEELVP